MKRITLLLFGLSILVTEFSRAETAPSVRLNTLGYLPDALKKATAVTSAKTFEVVRISDGKVALRGEIAPSIHEPDTNEDVALIDFSKLSEIGDYRLKIEGLPESAVFRVSPEVYREPFVVVTRAMYLWRCGVAVDGEWNGRRYHHAACHLGDAWLDFVTGEHEKKTSTGGWHDAGDYNKYVVNAGITVGSMLRAWEDFGPVLGKIALGLPEAGGPLPEYLAEVKFEIDWLLTMQAPDGSVYTKVSTEGFGGFILPEKETTSRYFCPWGTPATADFVAMLAQAARAFQPYDRAYAERCLAAAKQSYAFLTAHPEHHAPDQSHFKTGAYPTTDLDDRLWAAAELWETTQDAGILKDLESRMASLGTGFDEDFDWGNVKNLALLTYLFSQHEGRSTTLTAELKKRLLSVTDAIVGKAQAHGYGRPLGSKYYWGGNGGVARQALLLEAAYRLTQDRKYRDTTLDALNHLFGRNVDGRSYVTGLGSNPPLQPHDRRSGGDEVDLPWPGYLVGGPNPHARDWKDLQSDYRENEIAINWNGALIYALAAVAQIGTPASGK